MKSTDQAELSTDNAVNLYSVGAKFKSRQGHSLRGFNQSLQTNARSEYKRGLD